MIIIGPLSQIYPVIQSLRDLVKAALAEYPQLSRDAREQQARWSAFSELLAKLGINRELGRSGSVPIRLMGPDEFLSKVSQPLLERMYKEMEDLVAALDEASKLLGDPYVVIELGEGGRVTLSILMI